MTLGFCISSAIAQSDPTDAYARAEELVRNHEWDKGIAAVQPLLRSSPANLRLLNLAGLAYTGKGDPKQADQYFESALKLNPDFVPALKNLAINEAALGQIQPAREHLESALKHAPADPVANLYLGELLYRQQDFSHAAECLNRARGLVLRNPDLLASLVVSDLKTSNVPAAVELLDRIPAATLTARSQFSLGVALVEADLPSQALSYLQGAQTSNPSQSDISYDLALCFTELKRYPEAIATLQSLSGRETSASDNLLAEAYEANHDTQRAVATLRRAIAISPEDDNNYLEFASICIDHQAFDDAAKVLGVGLGVHPASARLLFERGILNAMEDHFELAEKDFQDSADRSPESNSAYIGLGVTFLETGNATKAIGVLRTRLQSQPRDANLCYLLGEALLRAGAQTGDSSFVEAQTYLERAVRLDPRLVEAHVSLGTIYLREQKFLDAAAQLEEARHLDPAAKSAYAHLAVAYRRLGEQEKSKAVLAELKDMNDRERAGSRQSKQSDETTPTLAPNAAAMQRGPD